MTLPEARSALARHEAALTALREHEATERAHAASRPRPPSGERPEHPSGTRPSPEAAARASGVAHEAAATALEAARWDADHALRTAEVTRADAAHVAAELESRWWAAFAQAMRDLPAAVLREAIGAMPPCPHARVTVSAEGEVAVEVMSAHGGWVDLGSASTGEGVRGSAGLRAAVRAAAAKEAPVWRYVPVVVDDAGAWSGDFEGLGLAWLLVTGGDALAVA